MIELVLSLLLVTMHMHAPAAGPEVSSVYLINSGYKTVSVIIKPLQLMTVSRWVWILG